MKNLLFGVIIGFVLLPAIARAAPCHYSTKELVVISLAIPVRLTPGECGDYDLWKLIPKDVPVPTFDDCTTDGWISRFCSAREALVARAKELKLEYEALDKAFDAIVAAEKEALLPIVALRAELNGKNVWVIYLNWEHRPLPPTMVRTKDGPKLATYPPMMLMHVRAYAYTIDRIENVGFITCQ